MRIRGRHAAALLAAVSLAMPAAAACAGYRPCGARLSPRRLRPVYICTAPGSWSIRYGVASGSIPRFDKATRVRASLAVAYTSMSTPISPHFVSWARLHADGAEPVIEILPRGHSLRGIASGSGDRWLRQLRAQITTPVVVSFAPEANGPWYTWGNNPRAYITAWRHVHRVLGTQHITWLWQMSSRPSARPSALPAPGHKLAEFSPGQQVRLLGRLRRLLRVPQRHLRECVRQLHPRDPQGQPPARAAVRDISGAGGAPRSQRHHVLDQQHAQPAPARLHLVRRGSAPAAVPPGLEPGEPAEGSGGIPESGQGMTLVRPYSCP